MNDRGSTLPLIIGFFLIAAVLVAGSVALGDAFVQQRELQSTCDGAAAAVAASGGDLERGSDVGSGTSLRFTDVERELRRYLDRDPERAKVDARARLSADRTRVTVRCRQTLPLAFGRYFGRATVTHTAVSTSRAAVVQ